jgi:hypothetical protein
MRTLIGLVAAVTLILLTAGCMGTFETARVVPFKIGATYFTSIESSEDDSFGMPGIVVETGWPAAAARFGIGLHLRVSAILAEDGDNGAMIIWGGKLQLPVNSIADIAFGLDMWGYFPGEMKLHISRKLGAIEPYVCIGIADFIDYNNSDSDILSTDGLVSYTFGTMVELDRNSGWVIAAEIEGGKVWASPGIGIGIIKQF